MLDSCNSFIDMCRYCQLGPPSNRWKWPLDNGCITEVQRRARHRAAAVHRICTHVHAGMLNELRICWRVHLPYDHYRFHYGGYCSSTVFRRPSDRHDCVLLPRCRTVWDLPNALHTSWNFMPCFLPWTAANRPGFYILHRCIHSVYRNWYFRGNDKSWCSWGQ